jgi:glycosyltransferase involved in cell wall biosynthesis
MVGACPYPVPQGSQVLLRNTAVALRDRGHDVHLVVYGYGVGEPDPGLTIHRCLNLPGARRIAAGPSPMKPLLDLALLATLRRVVRETDIQVVHAHNYEALIAALASGRRPVVYHAHNAMADELPHFLRGSRRFGAWLDRTFPRRADHVIAPHERLAEYLVECGCAHANLSVVPPSLDAGLFDVSTPADGTPPILYTGNLDPYQNLDLLVRSMKRVRDAIPEARLIVATAQRADVTGAEIVHVPDFDALRRIFATDFVVACPRIAWSGYPIKVLNAMAAGKAVVACESAAYPLKHGHDGLVVPDNDEAAFADALVRLARDRDLRAELGRNARATIENRHTPHGFAEAIERVYEGWR